MANTVNTNIIVPEVYATLVREKIEGRVVVAQTAKVIGELQNQPGETINIPAWSYIGDAEDIAVGTAMSATKMKQTKKSATVKMVASPAVSVNDYDDAVGLGSALDEAAKQQAIAMARKVDTDCIDAALTSPLKSAIATKDEITFDEMNLALGLYGDDANAEDFACIVAHSKFIPSFLKMDGFVSKEKTFTADNSGVMTNNVLGYFRGIAIVISDKCYDTTHTESFILVIKKDSIGIVPKEQPFVEVARDASTRTNTIYCSDYYAVTLIDEGGVVVVKSVIA